MSDKPVIFISHSSKDGEIANCIKKHLEPLLNIEVFETSHFEAIEGGEEWREKITQKLDDAFALLVLVSYNSKFSQWVHWEIGYFEKRRLMAQAELPVYIGTIGGERPFSTIDANQAKSLTDANEIRHLFRTIAKRLVLETDQSQFDNFVTELLEIVPVQITDESAIEKIKDYVENEYKENHWIDYAELDRDLKVSMGSSKTAISNIVQETDLWEVVLESAVGVRLKRNRPIFLLQA